MIGKSFLNVTVVAKDGLRHAVACVCGTQFSVRTHSLGRTSKRFRCPQCGTKNNLTRNSYECMRRRAPKRGLSVSDEWSKSYDAFVRDMGLRPSGTVLDRIDNSKGYSKENCRWADYKLSTENRTSTIWVETPRGKMRVNDVAEVYSLAPSKLYRRLKKGWDFERAVASRDQRQIKKQLRNV